MQACNAADRVACAFAYSEYYGNRQVQEGQEAVRTELLRELFRVEGESELRTMLSVVLGRGAGDGTSWSRVIRVPQSCNRERLELLPQSTRSEEAPGSVTGAANGHQL